MIESRPCVLVVDDSRDLREAVVAILEQEGYCAVPVADGRAALDVAEHEQPDVILLDYAMPHLDGLGFCRAYRALGRDTPIELITAALRVTLAEARRATEEWGAAAFMEKPFSVTQLLETLDRLVRH